MRINKDNVVNAVCIFLIDIVCCFALIIVLKSFYGQAIDVSFIKDIFSIGTTIATALIAIALFSDWKEEHNKQVENEFGLKTYNAFKQFENSLLNAHEIFTSLSSIINFFSESDLQLDDPLVIDRKEDMKLFFIQINQTEIDFKTFMSQLVDYCIITKQTNKIADIQRDLYRQFFKYYKNEEELSYSSFNQFYINYDLLFIEYLDLRKNTYDLLIIDILKRLQADN